MDSTQIEALRAVIAYLWEDEQKDYESLEDDGVKQDSHIYRHLMELKSYSDHYKGKQD